MGGGLAFAINKITTPQLGYREAVDAYARHGFAGITPWLDDIAEIGPAKAARIARDAGLEIAGFCNCGLFANAGVENRAAALDAARRAIDAAAEIGAPSIVTVVGGLEEGRTDLDAARDYAFDCLSETLEHARAADMPLALEPLHPLYTPDWSALNTLRMANDWCDRLGDGIGLTVDCYHVWWDAEAAEQIERAGRSRRILAFHISDWLHRTSDPLWDRGLPGDGVIDIAGFTRRARDNGYAGAIEIEMFSNTQSARPVDEFLQDLKARTMALQENVLSGG